MRTLSLLAFILFFGLAGLGVLLAERLVSTRGQAFLRSYSRHLALWNAHALVQIMQFILGTQFLPREAWGPLGIMTGPVVFLVLGASLYFLLVFASQVAGRRLPRAVPPLYASLWAGVLVIFALAAGAGTSTPELWSVRFFSVSFFFLKTGTVLAVTVVVLSAARRRDRRERRSLQAVAWTYLAGFLLFQFSVSGQVPMDRLPGHDYWRGIIQIGFHFPVLAALGHFARRRAAAAGSAVLFSPARIVEAGGTGLTARETEIVRLVLCGFSNKEIEAELFISLETVKKHLSSIYRKLGVKNRLQLSLIMQKPREGAGPLS